MKAFKIAAQSILSIIVLLALGLPIWLSYRYQLTQWEALSQSWMYVIYALIVYIFGRALIEMIWKPEEA